MKPLKRLSAAVIASLLLPSPLSASMYTGCSAYLNPRIASGQMPVRSACFMPAEGKLQKIGLLHSDVDTSESASWSDTIQTVIQSHFKAAGLEISQAIPAGGVSSSDAQAQVLLSLQQSFDTLAPQVHKHPKDIAKSAYTLGAGVAQLPCAARSDVLVFVQSEGQVVTGARTAIGLAVHAGPTDNTAQVFVTLADAKSGELVALFRISHVYLRGIANDPDKVYGGELDKEFKKINLAATTPTHP